MEEVSPAAALIVFVFHGQGSNPDKKKFLLAKLCEGIRSKPFPKPGKTILNNSLRGTSGKRNRKP